MRFSNEEMYRKWMKEEVLHFLEQTFFSLPEIQDALKVYLPEIQSQQKSPYQLAEELIAIWKNKQSG